MAEPTDEVPAADAGADDSLPDERHLVEDDPVQQTARTQFEAVVAAGEDALVLDVFRTHLAREVTPATYPELLDAGRFFLGPAAFAVIVGLAQERADDRRKLIASFGWSEEAKELVKQIVSRHAPAIDLAWDLWPPTRRAHDWSNVRAEVAEHHSETDREHSLRLEITKRNLDVVVIQGSPRSITRFARETLSALLLVEDPMLLDLDAITEIATTVGSLQARIAEHAGDDLHGDGSS
jgi:hypothetical protein